MICNLCPAGAGPCARRPRAGAYAGCRRRRWWPVRPSTSGRSRPSRARGAPAPCFLRLLPGVRLLPERRHQPPGLWTAHLPGAAACHLLRAHRPGAHNINLVNPTHYAHAVARLLAQPLPVPVVWNSGGYDRVDTCGAWRENPDLPARFEVCHAGVRGAVFRRGGLPEAAQAAILEMFRQTGPCVYQDGLLKQGVIIRHLLLPGKLAEAKRVMDWVAEHFPRRGGLLPHEPVPPLGAGGGVPRAEPPAAALGGPLGRGLYGRPGAGGLHPGAEAARSEYIPAFDLTGYNKRAAFPRAGKPPVHTSRAMSSGRGCSQAMGSPVTGWRRESRAEWRAGREMRL